MPRSAKINRDKVHPQLGGQQLPPQSPVASGSHKSNSALDPKAMSSAMTPHQAKSLNRMVGARAVQRIVQRRLKVGAANDPLEREADQMAAAVIGGKTKAVSSTQPNTRDDVQTKKHAANLASAAEGNAFETSTAFDRELTIARSGGRPIPSEQRQQMETGFGADFGDVRLHSGDRASALSQVINAEAFTQGNDIFFGAGMENTQSAVGQHRFAHELTHTLQQGSSTVWRKQVWGGVNMLPFGEEGEGEDQQGEYREPETRSRRDGSDEVPPIQQVDNRMEASVDEAISTTEMHDALQVQDMDSSVAPPIPGSVTSNESGRDLDITGEPGSEVSTDPQVLAQTNRSIALTNSLVVPLQRDGQLALRDVDEQVAQGRKRSASFSGGQQSRPRVESHTRGRRLSLSMRQDRPGAPPLNGGPARLARAGAPPQPRPRSGALSVPSELVPQMIEAPVELQAPIQQPRAPGQGSELANAIGHDDRHTGRSGHVQSLADIGGQTTTLVDMGMGLTNFGDASHPVYQSGAQHFRGHGVSFADYNNATANSTTAGLGMGLSGIGGLISIGMSIKNVNSALDDIRSAVTTKDPRRGIEATGTVVENLATMVSATSGTLNSVNTFVGSVSSAGSSAISSFGGAAIPILGAVVGTIGAIKNTYQIATAHARVGKLEAIANAEGVHQDLQMVARYAIETNKKRRNRGAINLTANTTGAIGGIVTASGVGAGVGAAVAASGAAVKYGAMATRMSKQALRNKRAVKREAKGKTDSYVQWEKRKLDEGGFKNWLNVKLTPNWDKTTLKKDAQREKMARSLLERGEAGVKVLKHLGGTVENLKRQAQGWTQPDASNHDALKTIMKLFSNRE